jgi:hypothetical protein
MSLNWFGMLLSALRSCGPVHTHRNITVTQRTEILIAFGIRLKCYTELIKKIPPFTKLEVYYRVYKIKAKAVPLHAMEEFGGRGGIAPTHSRPRH